MRKSIRLGLLLISMLSLSSQAQTNNDPGKKDPGTDHFTLLDPIFKFNGRKHRKKPRAVHEMYEKRTSYTLDSLFNVDSRKYRVNEKLSYKRTKVSANVEDEISLLFKHAKATDRGVDISPEFKSILSNANNRYGVLIFIDPMVGHYFSSGNPTILKTSMEIIILDLTEHEIVFYNRSKALRTFNVGFTRPLIKNLDYLYNKIEEGFKFN